MRVEDVMKTAVVTARPDTPLKAVAGQLAEHRISGLPVVTDDGEVLGVVSESDLLFKERGAPEEEAHLLSFRRGVGGTERRKRDARVAADAMTAPAFTISPLRSIAAAADAMIEHRINRLPVVRDGRLVGIVTRADLVRAFARSDERVLGEVKALVESFLAIDGDLSQPSLTIDAGEVMIAGRVRRRLAAEALPHLAQSVPGVVAVHAELTWAEDESKHERLPRERAQSPL